MNAPFLEQWIKPNICGYAIPRRRSQGKWQPHVGILGKMVSSEHLGPGHHVMCILNVNDKQPGRWKHAIKPGLEKALFTFICGKLCPAENPNIWLAPAASSDVPEKARDAPTVVSWSAASSLLCVSVWTRSLQVHSQKGSPDMVPGGRGLPGGAPGEELHRGEGYENRKRGPGG